MTQETKTTKNEETAEHGDGDKLFYVLNVSQNLPNTAHLTQTTESYVRRNRLSVKKQEQRTCKGVVRWYSAKGFGFIDPSPSTDGRAIYFHLSDVKNRTVLKTGDEVTFETAPTLKGPKAINVQAADTKEEITCQQKL
jgi:cold shock CspA family protein